MIKKQGKKYILVSKSTGRTLGTHRSRAAAMRQEAAINISKSRKIPKR